MLVRATTTFHAPDNVTVRQGDILDDTDDMAVKYPQFFTPVETTAKTRAALVAALTEPTDATARPGARRGQPKA